MGRAPRWANMVDSSRLEALNAVEFYNRPASRRPLEAFLVHMHIAWLYLLHAEFLKAGIDYRYRDPQRPARYLKVDGETKTWDLDRVGCQKSRRGVCGRMVAVVHETEQIRPGYAQWHCLAPRRPSTRLKKLLWVTRA